MKYLSVACPTQSVGLQIVGKKIVVPNQAMSLEEILRRFVRDESLPIGKDSQYYEDGDEDLEKIPHMDLVDQSEYMDGLKETQKIYKRQEAQREKAARDKIAADFKIQVENDVKKAAEKAAKAE